MKYTIGIDFGTLSARAVLVDSDGNIVCDSTREYTHKVMSELKGALPKNFAIQHPDDYVDALTFCIKEVVKTSKVSPSDIVGLGIDFTSSTVMSVDEEEVPTCKKGFETNPHAYVKLWKHHGAEAIAERMEKIAKERGERWLARSSGKISCEFALPKIVETLEKAPEVYSKTSRFVEAGDWITGLLVGKKLQTSVFAGYKWCYDKSDGYPSNEYFKAIDPRLDGIVGDKILDTVTDEVVVGYLTDEWAKVLGLEVSTPVARPMIDAHSALPALGVIEEGSLMLIIGTSGCQILNSKKRVDIDGIFGYVYDSIIPNNYTYEAGQSAVGDIFDWVVKNCVNSQLEEEAKNRGINIHKLLRERAKKLKVGESGLIALDWLNGNRSILQNPKLKGMILGLTLNTKPWEIYRAFIEATAFGVRVILESFYKSGIKVDKIVAGGGIATKDDMLMQIYADVLGLPISVSNTEQAGAVGSATFASVAGGLYPDIVTASKKMTKEPTVIYAPCEQNVKAYDLIYNEYKKLHDYFGKREQ